MENTDGHIVILLSNKGYIAIENNEIFQLWKYERLGSIYNELHNRYPQYEITLGSLDEVDFDNAIRVYNQFIESHQKPVDNLSIVNSNNSWYKIITNSNKDLETGIKTMKSRNEVKVKALAVIGINITAGVMHLGLQTMADTVCYAEAQIIQKLNVFDKTVDEIMNARKTKTKESQESLIRLPKLAKTTASEFSGRIKDIKDKAIVNSNS